MLNTRAPGLLIALVIVVGCTTPPGPDESGPDAGEVPDVDAQADAGADPDAAPVTVTPTEAARPAIASGGGSHLVVWDTPRNGTTDIYGTRMSASGQVLDPDGMPIAVAAGTQIGPRVAFNGQLYLVVWKDNRLGRAAIFGARVQSDGVVLDPGGIVIDDSGGSTQFPDVASDGTGFLVVWEGPCSAADCEHGVSGAVVSASGAVSARRRIAAPAALSYTPAVAFGGGTYLVTWAEIAASGEHDLHARLVSPSGTLGLERTVSAAAGNQIIPAVASDGAGFLVVWQDTRGGGLSTYAARVAANGTVVDPAGLALSAAGRWRDGPDVVHNGADYVVAWSEPVANDAVAVITRLVRTDGTSSPASVSFAAPTAGGSPLDDDKHPMLTAGGGHATVTWQTHWEVAPTVVGGRLSAANEVLGPATPLSTAIVH